MLLLAALATPVAAQGVSLLNCHQVFEPLIETHRPKPSDKSWDPRTVLEGMATGWIKSDVRLADGRRRNVVKFSGDKGSLMVIADNRVTLALQGAFEQLRKRPQQDHRIACTIVTMPIAVATGHGLKAGISKPADEIVAGDLFKAAVAADGKLVNLPNTRSLPLVEYVARSGDPKAGDARALGATGTVLPTGKNSVLLQLAAAGHVPQYLRLVRDRGVLLWLPAGEKASEAHVVWVRYLGAVRHQPAPAEPKRDGR